MKPSVLLFVILAAFSAESVANVTIVTSTLPNGTVGTLYSATISAKGGCGPYVWTVSGALPDGLTSAVNKSQLTISGTPTTAASYSFSVSVKGCGGHTSQVAYTVVIQAEAAHVVNLNWTASNSPNIAGYNMYRGPDGTCGQKINTGGLIPSTLYTDSTGANGTTYYYASTAVDTSGMESSKSASVEVTIP